MRLVPPTTRPRPSQRLKPFFRLGPRFAFRLVAWALAATCALALAPSPAVAQGIVPKILQPKDAAMPNKAPRHPLDVPQALGRIFHPRPDPAGQRGEPLAQNDAFAMAPDGEKIHLRFFIQDAAAPNLIFFHGNGEIVADYDDLAPLFLRAGVNCVFVEYRGYGLSTGSPTLSYLYTDCLSAFDFALLKLEEKGCAGKIIVMGRSLGSACALEVAASRRTLVDGLIIESGFAFALPLLETLGVDAAALGATEETCFGNLKNAANWDKPLLVIHAERDRIIPHSDGRALFKASPSKSKIFLSVPQAGHNDIFVYGMDDYLRELGAFAAKIGAGAQ